MEASLSQRLETVRRKMEDYEKKGYDKKYEEDWKKLLNELNDIKLKIYKEKIFSDNEEFKDIKTEDIKFMLVAFYQSELIQKFMANRKNILEFALKFYDEFYNLLQTYEYLSKEQVKKYKKLTHKDEEEENKKKTPQQSFEEMSQSRTEKIEMYKYKKNLSEKIKKIEEAGFDYIQIHGELEETLLNSIHIPVLKAFNVKDMDKYPFYHSCPQIAGYVFDAAEPGSGKTFDWNLVKEIPRDEKLLLLAGGLNPENVIKAIEAIHPDGVDVSSSVEYEDIAGKNPEKVTAFVQAVRKM